MNNEANLKKVSTIFLLFLICTASCNTVDPPDKTVLTLILEDVSCTEAWITLTANNLQLPATINLLKDNSITKTINLQTADTLLYIDSLLPNQTYNFKLSGIGYPVSGINSKELSVTTMDTTSHNFTWQTFTFGDIGNSVMFDVAIISENNIWCVGEIRIADNSPSGYTSYSYVKWNGDEWELGKLKYFPPGSIGDSITTTGLSVFAFNDDDVWISGGAVFHWNGSIWKVYYNTGADGSNKIWGTSSNNLYFVGRNGNIIHYNGSQWRKIESGTTLGLSDIYGNKHGDLYACGGNPSTGQGIVLKINSNNTVTKIIDGYYYGTGFDSTKMFTENLYGPITSIWVNSNGTVYTVGNLIYRYNLGLWDYAKGIEYNYLGAGFFSGRGFSLGIRGKAINDFIFVGQRNTIRYVNGTRAVQLGEPFSYDSDYHWSGIDYKQNTAVAAGRKEGYAAVMVFKR